MIKQDADEGLLEKKIVRKFPAFGYLTTEHAEQCYIVYNTEQCLIITTLYFRKKYEL